MVDKEASMDRVDKFRAEVKNLSQSINDLNSKLDTTITREEVSDEIAERLNTIEQTVTSLLGGTKAQIRRTRHAAWILWSFILLLVSFATIQVHEAHLNECAFSTEQSAGKQWVCEALFPFTDHENMLEFQDNIRRLNGEDVERAHHHYTVSPQFVGGAFYLALFGGTAWGVLAYRKRSRQEDDVEGSETTPNQLAAVAAVHEAASTKSREDTP